MLFVYVKSRRFVFNGQFVYNTYGKTQNASSVDCVCVRLRACVFVIVRKMAALVGIRACLSGKLQMCFFSYRVTLRLFACYECFACGIYHLYVHM